VHGSDVHAALALTRARTHLAAGQLAEGRDALITALDRAGLDVAGYTPRTEQELATRPAVWVVLVGMSLDDGYTVHVVPEAELDEAARFALSRCDGHVVGPDTAREQPELYRAYAQVLALLGRAEWEDVVDATRGEPQAIGLTRAAHAAWLGRWRKHAATTPAERGARLDARITRVVSIFEAL
jgi:hypothetical protein